MKRRPKLTLKNLNWPLVIVVLLCLLFWVSLLGCDWNQQTIEEFNAQGQLIYRRDTNMGSILKESLIENGKMVSDPNHFEITVKHAEFSTSDIKAVTPYGTLEIE